MELIVIIPLTLIVLVIVWNLRKAFFSQSSVWRDKVELSARDSASDLQEDFKTTVERIKAVKESNNGKWFTMSDVDELTK